MAQVSTTAAETTVITMADGGYRPAYSGRFVSDTASQVIVGVEAVTADTDYSHLGKSAFADFGYIAIPD